MRWQAKRDTAFLTQEKVHNVKKKLNLDAFALVAREPALDGRQAVRDTVKTRGGACGRPRATGRGARFPEPPKALAVITDTAVR